MFSYPLENYLNILPGEYSLEAHAVLLFAKKIILLAVSSIFSIKEMYKKVVSPQRTGNSTKNGAIANFLRRLLNFLRFKN